MFSAEAIFSCFGSSVTVDELVRYYTDDKRRDTVLDI